MGALRHRWTDRGWKWPSALSTGTELRSIRLSHFDSPGSLNCLVNLAAALSCLTYWSPESVLRVLCPTNRLLCPPSSLRSLSTRSDRPVVMIPVTSPPRRPPPPPAPQIPNHDLVFFHTPPRADTEECDRWTGNCVFPFSKSNNVQHGFALQNKHINECCSLTHAGSFLHLFYIPSSL